MSYSTGLRRFVSGPPSAAQAGAVPSTTGPSTTGPSTTGPSTTGPAAPGSGQPGQPDQSGQPGWSEPAAPEEKCELCATVIPAEHGHLADLDHSSLLCACRACYLLFTSAEATRGRYRAVPDRYLADPDHRLTVAECDELDVPVGLAFFLRSSRRPGVTGFYPSPAGATECRLDLAAWERLAADHPLLAAAADDVEAVLISRSGAGVECFVVPVDACYELAGRMRLLWRGFDGGTEARQAIDAFLGHVRGLAVPVADGRQR